jgi:hypothetical protein
MSFTAGDSGPSVANFGPSRVDVRWDGFSNAKATILPVCADTATSTVYSVKALHVFPDSGSKAIFSSGSTITLQYSPGQPFVNTASPNAATAVPFALGSTVSPTSGSVTFDIIASNTNFTATFDTPTDTNVTSHYKWWIEQEKPGSKQIVAVGKITRIPPNPYASESVYGDLVQDTTATFCVG